MSHIGRQTSECIVPSVAASSHNCCTSQCNADDCRRVDSRLMALKSMGIVKNYEVP